jgi:hypothetical protein
VTRRVGPCDYCTLEHGGNLFPDLLTRLVDGGPDPYQLLAVVRKTLCTSVRLASLECDPAICASALDHALAQTRQSDRPLTVWGWEAKQTYRGYHERHHDSIDRNPGLDEAILDDLLGPG